MSFCPLSGGLGGIDGGGVVDGGMEIAARVTVFGNDIDPARHNDDEEVWEEEVEVEADFGASVTG